MLEFRPIEIGDKDRIDSFVKPYEFIICEYSSVYLYIWKDVLNFEICYDDNVLYIRGHNGKRYLYLIPVAKEGKLDEYYLKLEEFAASKGEPWQMVCAEYKNVARFTPQFLSRYTLEKNVKLSDYIYRTEDLAELKGKKYHKKRNHVSKFNSKYEYEFLPLEKKDFDECINFYFEWMSVKTDEMTKEMKDEMSALKHSFEKFNELCLVGACIKIDGKIEGFCIGEYTNSKMATIHFEKCNADFDGIYATINQLFIKEYFSESEFINRQDDMGLEGLKKAKQSYYPCMMGDKYVMTGKGE